jgi:hypothetical protein
VSYHDDGEGVFAVEFFEEAVDRCGDRRIEAGGGLV